MNKKRKQIFELNEETGEYVEYKAPTKQWLSTSVYVTISDAEYIREKLGREPVSKDFVKALLKELSTK
jgi:hypothetical protein